MCGSTKQWHSHLLRTVRNGLLILTRLTTWTGFGIHTSCPEDTMIDRRTLCASRLFGNSADCFTPGSPRLNGSANVLKPTHLFNKSRLGESATSDNGQCSRSLQGRVVSLVCPRMLSEARGVVVVPS
jgi:hypothetical protein